MAENTLQCEPIHSPQIYISLHKTNLCASVTNMSAASEKYFRFLGLSKNGSARKTKQNTFFLPDNNLQKFEFYPGCHLPPIFAQRKRLEQSVPNSCRSCIFCLPSSFFCPRGTADGRKKQKYPGTVEGFLSVICGAIIRQLAPVDPSGSAPSRAVVRCRLNGEITNAELPTSVLGPYQCWHIFYQNLASIFFFRCTLFRQQL